MSQSVPYTCQGKNGDRLERLDAVVESVRFTSPNGFGVVRVRPAQAGKGKDVFSAVGTIGDVREGERVVISGTWTDSDKYGKQLSVTEYEVPDLSGSNVREFLIGGFVKGISQALGQRIWDEFGEGTAEIFEKEPGMLLRVSGIGKSKLPKILQSWKEEAGKRTATVTFRKIGLDRGR